MKYSSVIITGASSGIGKALSIALALKSKNLYLLGRNKSKLESVKEICIKMGACVEIFSVDIKDREKVAEVILSIDKTNAVDLVIANAGMGTAQSAELNNGVPNYNEIITNKYFGHTQHYRSFSRTNEEKSSWSNCHNELACWISRLF